MDPCLKDIPDTLFDGITCTSYDSEASNQLDLHRVKGLNPLNCDDNFCYTQWVTGVTCIILLLVLLISSLIIKPWKSTSFIWL